MGSNMVEFLSNLDGLQNYISSSEKFKSQVPPSSRCEFDQNKLTLHFYTSRRNLLEYYAGIVIGISRHLFHKEATLTVSPNENTASIHHIFTIVADDNAKTSECKICSSQQTYSKRPSDSKIATSTFCKTFPFHLIMDRKLNIIQIGEALNKHVVAERKTRKNLLLTSYFEIVRPKIEPLTFSALLSHVNCTFGLRTKQSERSLQVRTMIMS